jgi:acyl-coenzyme A thioesterase PaaI-like protein
VLETSHGAAAVEEHADGVEADRLGEGKRAPRPSQPGGGEPPQPGTLGAAQQGQRLEVAARGPPAGAGAAGLDLGEHERAPVKGDDVYLAGPCARVALQDAKAERLQMLGRVLLARAAEGAAAIVAGRRHGETLAAGTAAIGRGRRGDRRKLATARDGALASLSPVDESVSAQDRSRPAPGAPAGSAPAGASDPTQDGAGGPNPTRPLDGVSSFMGIRWTDAQTVRLRIRPELINAGGLLSGVATYAMVDYCMGSTLWVQTTAEERIATISISINYIQTATEGEIVCRSELDRRNRHIGILKSTVHAENGVLLATAIGSYSIFTKKR